MVVLVEGESDAAAVTTVAGRYGIQPESLYARRAWDLSGGEKRIVAVVSALIAPASLLALDEPTAGLDRARRAALAGLVRRRAESGPVLIASQDTGWVERLAARVVRVGDWPG